MLVVPLGCALRTSIAAHRVVVVICVVVHTSEAIVLPVDPSSLGVVRERVCTAGLCRAPAYIVKRVGQQMAQWVGRRLLAGPATCLGASKSSNVSTSVCHFN